MIASQSVQRVAWILLGLLVLIIVRPALPWIIAAATVTLGPAFVVSGLIYARGGLHAFCLGAAAAGGLPFLYIALATYFSPVFAHSIWRLQGGGYAPGLCALIAGVAGGAVAWFLDRRRDVKFRREKA